MTPRIPAPLHPPWPSSLVFQFLTHAYLCAPTDLVLDQRGLERPAHLHLLHARLGLHLDLARHLRRDWLLPFPNAQQVD